MDTLKITRKQAKPIVDVTFPEYTGRKITVRFQTSVTFYDTNWDGGTKSDYAAVNVDGRTGRFEAPAPWINPLEGKTVNLPVDVLIVKHSYFCGQDAGITIYAHPANAPRLLTA